MWEIKDKVKDKSNHTYQHFIYITTHFVDSPWKLHKRILRFRALTSPYDGESITNEVFMFLTQWNIEHKILTITMDSAKYNDVMVANMKKHIIPKNGLVSSGVFFHVRYLCTYLELYCTRWFAFDWWNSRKIQSLVKLITKSSQRSNDFSEIAEIFFISMLEENWISTCKFFGI